MLGNMDPIYKTLPRFFRWRLDPDSDTTPNTASKVSYQQAYTDLLENFNLRGDQSPALGQLQSPLSVLLWEKIHHYSQWIIIFDNAGSFSDIQDYLPRNFEAKGQILVTTQNSRFITTNMDANFSINRGLHEDDAIQLLKEVSHRSQEDVTTARNLVERLDSSPLAIRIAASYISNMADLSFTTYIQILNDDIREQTLTLLGRDFIGQSVEDRERRVTLQGALRLAIVEVRGYNPGLFSLLQSCAFLANENIPLELLLGLFGVPDRPQQTPYHQSLLHSTMIGKHNHSLLAYDVINQSYYLHRTTQVVVRQLTQHPAEIIKKTVVTILQLYPYEAFSMERLRMCRKISPHLLALHQHVVSNLRVDPTLIFEQVRLLLILGQLTHEFSQYSLALQYLEQAKNLVQELPSTDPGIQIEILRCIGETKQYLGEYPEAQLYLEQALQLKSQSKSKDWHLARIYNHLGHSLEHIDLQRSLQVYQEAEKICRIGQHGSRDLELQLARSYTGIGHCLRLNQNFPDAIRYYNKTLEIYQQHLTPSLHTASTLIIYLRLGSIGLSADWEKFLDVGINYSTCVKYLQQHLLIHTEAYGPHSHDVAISNHWLGGLLGVSEKREDWELALRHVDASIEILRTTMGSDFGMLVNVYYIKGKILERLDRKTEAIVVYRQVLDVGQPHHKDRWIYRIQKTQERLQRLENLVP